jgi:hypothetical protein
MVYVDKLITYPKSTNNHDKWCHMWADSLTELHDFAKRLRMSKSWFQDNSFLPHYDLTETRRKWAIREGALEISIKEYKKLVGTDQLENFLIDHAINHA